MKIRFESDDDLLTGKISSILSMIIDARAVVQKDNKYYPPVYLYECGHEFVSVL